MKKNKTVLEKIGISDKLVKEWRTRGLKITYPVRQNPYYFKSADGKVFIENADKFVPLLTKKETKLYIKYPDRFKKDFFENAKLYKKFVNFIYKVLRNIERLKEKERVAALLSLMYLFQRAMDYHYFHWDRYLVYEDYPQTPVGYWFEKLRILYIKATGERISKLKPSENFLKLLSGNKEILKNCEGNLNPKDSSELKRALKSIKIFEDIQQKEIEFFVNFKTKENIFIRTGFDIWNKLLEKIKKHPGLVKKKEISKIKKIMSHHPIVGIRKTILVPNLKCFDKEIFYQFREEISRWL